MERVTQLKGENEELEENIKILTKELSVLKDLYVAHAGNFVMYLYSLCMRSH